MAPRGAKLAVALVVGLAALVPTVLPAQPSERVWRIGFLGQAPPVPVNQHIWDALIGGLRDHGYVEGRNLVIERRYSMGRQDRVRELAAELVTLKPDLIITTGTPNAHAAKQSTSSIPIVMVFAGDPVSAGVVSNLARPGGNVTGSSLQAVDITAKQLGLLKELLPGASRVAVLWNPRVVVHGPAMTELDGAARSLRVQLLKLEVPQPEDPGAALRELERQPPAGLVVFDQPGQNRRRIIEGATRNRIPSVYMFRTYVDEGGLMSYGPELSHLARRTGAYVDKILKGAKPGDLPVEQPTHFELVINLKTAAILGLTIPPGLLNRADHLIR